jgi:multidrug efflux pump subunit AcrB
LIGVAVAAVGLFLLRATWGTADEVILRQYSEDWRPWNRGHTLRVRLDIDRLRAYDLSKEDVMRALTPSRMVDPKEPPAPPGVVFVTRVYKRLDQYENIILKANAEGDVVRLKDVAKVEFGW